MAEWKCKEGCDAECCDVIPIKDKILDEHKHLFQREIIKKLEYPKFSSTLLLTEDNKCVFLSPKNKCVIYDKRPEICRKYGQVDVLECKNFDMEGNPR